jgi:hypothetical protein
MKRHGSLSHWPLAPLALALFVLVQLVTACGVSKTPDAPPARAVSSRALSDPTCVTLQRGAAGSVSDTHISSQQPDHNAGSLPELYVGQVGRHARQGLLYFDTSSIPSHATLSSATLALWAQGPDGPSALTAHAITKDWQETSVTWGSFASGFAPQTAASVTTSSRPGPVSLSLTTLVSAWVRFPALNHGVLLQQPDGHTLLQA